MMTPVHVLLLMASLLGVATAAAPFGTPGADCSVASRPQLAFPGPYANMSNAQSCFNTATRALKASLTPDIIGPCLRAAFHDCGTYRASTPPNSAFNRPTNCGGCNGSLKKEFEAGTADNFASFPQQNGMLTCYNLLFGTTASGGIGGLYATVKSSCPAMSKADFISLAGYVAVIVGGGAPAGGCGWYPGRLDDADYDNTNFLPPESMNADQMHNWFDQYEMGDAEAHFSLNHDETVATLSGAHTIGKSRVHGVNPTSRGVNALSGTPDKFDGGYYAEVIAVNGLKGQFGWFASDMHGFCNTFKSKDGGGGGGGGGGKGSPSVIGRKLMQSVANDIPGVPPPTDNNVGTPGGVPGLNLDKEVCANVTPNVKGDSRFAQYYLTYGNNFNKGDDRLFKGKFCMAYQAMSTIGFKFPTDYDAIAPTFILS